MTPAERLPMTFAPAGPLEGIARVPGDKSISHRALMLAAMAPRDHRVAMSFAVAGLHAVKPVTVEDMSPVATSFPTFAAVLSDLAR